MSVGKPTRQAEGDYQLRLFIAGQTQRSVRAVRNITRICEQHLRGHYDLEVIDLYQQPEMAVEHQLLAAPTLVRLLPLPLRRMIGDMSNTDQVLAKLGIAQRG